MPAGATFMMIVEQDCILFCFSNTNWELNEDEVHFGSVCQSVTHAVTNNSSFQNYAHLTWTSTQEELISIFIWLGC